VDLLYFAGADGVRCHRQCLEPYWLAGLAQLLPEERPEPKGANLPSAGELCRRLAKLIFAPGLGLQRPESIGVASRARARFTPK